jgi:hypothetical protein
MVNYTVSVINETVDKSNDSIAIYGPYLHFGPGTVSHAIASGLERDKEYSAIVKVWIESQVIESHGVSFSKKRFYFSYYGTKISTVLS